MRRPCLFGNYKQNSLCTVEGIEALCPAADSAVEIGQLVAQLFIGYYDNARSLMILSACSVKTGVDYLIKNLILQQIRLIFSDAASFLYGLLLSCAGSEIICFPAVVLKMHVYFVRITVFVNAQYFAETLRKVVLLHITSVYPQNGTLVG